MSSPKTEAKNKDAVDSATSEPTTSDTTILQDESSSSHDSNAKKPGAPQESQGSDAKPTTAGSNDNDDDLVARSTEEDVAPYVTSATTASSPPPATTAATTATTTATTTESSPTLSTTTTTAIPVTPVAVPVLTPVPMPAPVPVPAPGATPAPNAEREARLAILTEAFPTVDREVCEFVLESHRGNVEASINALLEISDPDFQAEPPQQVQPPQQQQQQQRQQQQQQAPVADSPPALPRRQPDGQVDSVTQGFGDLGLGQQRREIDPILLASTSTPEQQLRSDEELARSIALMEENQARERYRQQQQQQQPQEPSFTTEIKELMEEELPKIKERFNVAADTTKRKVTEWYNQFKSNREAAAQRQRQQNEQERGEEIWSSDHMDNGQAPIRYGSRSGDEGEEPLARHRATPPLESQSPPLPARASNSPRSGSNEDSTTDRRSRIEEELEVAMNTQPSRR